MDSRPDDESLLLAVAERDMGAFRALWWIVLADLLAVVGQLSTPVPALWQVS